MTIKTFFDFCSGIGGGRLGLEQAGLECVGRSETSRLADIPIFDLLIAGFPCQTFSVIGRQDGFSDDRGQIIFQLARILRETQPICFILENVKGLVTHDKGNTIKVILNELTEAGYTVLYRVLTSLNYGVPQMRQRVYFVGFKTSLGLDYSKFKWPEPASVPPLSNYLIDNKLADEERLDIFRHYLNNITNAGKYSVDDIRIMEGKIIDTRMNDLRIYTGKCPTLRAQRDGILYVRNGMIYQLTGYEALLLQGFPREYVDKVKNKVSDRHLLMQAGNAMTVNVIKALGDSIIDFLSMKEENKVRPGEKFEIRCYEYLKKFYKTKSTDFYHEGGMDSTKSDIAAIKNGKIVFYIEAKDASAQSGQFVLLPNEDTKTFVFSPRNKSEPNEMTNIIIDYMNSNFQRFNNAGTSGEKLNINTNIFADWIIEHYENKNVRYVISCDKDYVIFPIRKFKQYFDIVANYRIKKSGSREPAQKDIFLIKQYISNYYSTAEFVQQDKKLYVEIAEPITTDRFILGKYTFYLSKQTSNKYEIRKLSNTYNMNVIFSIELIKTQAEEDLEEFESDL